MKKTKKLLCLLIVIAISVSALVGCTNKKETSEDSGKITYWAPFYPHYSQLGTSMGDAPFFKELQARTGVEIEFIHPPVGEESANFNLMVASGELPDVIEFSFLSYKGGPEKAIDDNVIMDITDLIKEKAPNLSKQLADHPDWDKQVKTDSGKYYCFPAIRGDEFLDYWQGPQVRQDYLEKVGMEAPETIEEWEAMLRAFKTELGIETPLTLKSNAENAHAFVGAYGITKKFFVDGGKVKFGPMTDEYEEYITLMAKWMKEGLLDPDFATHDAKTFDAKVASGKAGAYVGSAGGDMGKFIAATSAQNPEAKLVAVKPPVLKKGDAPKIGFKDFDYIPAQSVSVTTACKNLDSVFKLFDYAYGEEGHMFYNFGVEGTSYNMVDGYPTYTDDIIHPKKEGVTVQFAMTEFTRAAVMGPMIQDKRYFEQYMVNENQKATATAWKLDGDASWRMPNVTYTIEEAGKVASKLNEIESYLAEMEIKFITGAEPISKLGDFRKDLEKLGLNDVMAIMQTAVDRYNSRN